MFGVAGVAVLVTMTLTTHTATSPVATKVALKAWGNNDEGQLGIGHLTIGSLSPKPTGVKVGDAAQVYAGLRHSLALTSKGQVWAWGDDTYGQLGDGKKGGKRVTPHAVTGLPKITMLATKQDHTLALDSTGHVWAWGLNISGQLGDGTNVDRAVPHKVPALDNVRYIATGYRSSLAVKKDGSVWVWGGNCNTKQDKSLASYVSQLTIDGYSDGSGGTIESTTPEDDCLHQKYLNIKSNVPKKIEGLPKISQVSAGFGHVLAISQSGDLWSWGCNLYGQVGNGVDGNSEANLQPVKIGGVGNVVAVSAGYRHSMALDAAGHVWTWGHSFFGELGDGKAETDADVVLPHRVAGLANVTMISAGHDYSLAVTKQGKLFGWGQASFDQLGSNDETTVSTPKALQQLRTVRLAAAGGAHVITLLNTDNVQ